MASKRRITRSMFMTLNPLISIRVKVKTHVKKSELRVCRRCEDEDDEDYEYDENYEDSEDEDEDDDDDDDDDDEIDKNEDDVVEYMYRSRTVAVPQKNGMTCYRTTAPSGVVYRSGRRPSNYVYTLYK